MRSTNTEITPGVVLLQIQTMLDALQKAERQVISAIEEHNNDPHAHGGAIGNAVKSLLPRTDPKIEVNRVEGHVHTGGSMEECDSCSDIAQVPTHHVASGDYRVSISSPSRMDIRTSGAVTLYFDPADVLQYSVKVIVLKAEDDTVLTIRGAYWVYNDCIPPWEKQGETIILTAHFAGGCVIVSAAETSGE